jgi:hypothetical protein
VWTRNVCRRFQSLRRHIAENHPDGIAKETFLLVLDQMILEAVKETL